MLNISKEDWIKVGKGALIALAGAAITYLPTITGILEFGPWTPVITAGISILVNYLRKLVTQEQPQ
jgi:hypothetical protein